MELTLNNLIEAQAYLTLVALVYHFILRHLTFYKFNRSFILTGALFAAIVPFLPQANSAATEFTATLPILKVSNQWQVILPATNSSLSNIIWIMILSVTAILFIKTSIQASKLLRGKLIEKDKLNYIISNHPAAPFSLFKYIVVNQLPLDKAIEIHEATHVKQHHYIDLLILQCIAWINWFNPFSWLLLKSAKSNHELLADQEVLNHGYEKKQYQQLMLQQVLQTNIPVLANTFFNQSILKQRIMMMKKKQSNKKALLNALWALPIALFIFVACSETTESAEPVIKIAEVMPEYKGGNEALFAYLGESIQYPKEALADSLEGTVYVSFIIDKMGEVTEAKILRGVDERLDAVALEVVSNMPQWTPGKQKGKPVAVQYNLPIRFTLK
jgi:TonB family protein